MSWSTRKMLLYWVKNCLHIRFDFFSPPYNNRQLSSTSVIHLWRLFNVGFHAKHDPHVAICSAQLFSCYLFSPPFSSHCHIFSLCVCRAFMPPTFHPPLPPTPPPPSPFTSLAIPRNPIPARAWKVKGVPLSSSHLLHRLLQTLLRHLASQNTASFHVRGTCRHPNATFDHCFYWDPSPPCCALGWQEEAGEKRLIGREE